ncbi:MAG: O-antigen ligase family protein [Maribacter litoralis]|uniref:O-antigen ligase family protein n=1 Tax=Maribacter litoralis TaxID=2059726 RepID=UPI00329A7FB9
MEFLRKINNSILYLLIFSITFENWDPLNTSGSLSVAFIISILYISSWVPFFRSGLNLFIFKKYISLLILFILIGFVSTAFNSEHLIELSQAYNFRVLTLIILMYLITNHFYNQPELIEKGVNVYLIGIVLMFLLFSLGIGVSYEQDRLLIFKENPNIIGVKAVLAFVIVMGKLFSKSIKLKQFLNPIILVLPAAIILIFATGSRGAFLSIFIGFVFILFFKKMPILKKVIFVIIGVVFAGLTYNYALENNKILQERLTKSVQSGDTREVLWEGAIKIIENNPLIGVGFTNLFPEMYKHSGFFLYPHNVFLYVLATTGIIGFIFYMFFILRVFIGLYKSYQLTRNVTYLVLFLMIVVNLMKVGGGINMMLFWFFFALLLGSALVVNNPKVEEHNL